MNPSHFTHYTHAIAAQAKNDCNQTVSQNFPKKMHSLGKSRKGSLSFLTGLLGYWCYYWWQRGAQWLSHCLYTVSSLQYSQQGNIFSSQHSVSASTPQRLQKAETVTLKQLLSLLFGLFIFSVFQAQKATSFTGYLSK